MKKITLIIVSIALLMGTQSCIENFNNGICISGLGEIVSEEVALDPFKSVNLETVIDVEILQGDEQKVIVEGNENMLDEISLQIVKGELKIDLKNNCYNKFDLKVFITLPELKAIENNSTGNITLGGFKNLNSLNIDVKSTGNVTSEDEIEVNESVYINCKSTGNVSLTIFTNEITTYISSTGNVELQGSCVDQNVELDGTGHYKALEFESETCKIVSDGIGDAKVWVTKKMEAYINSVGSIYVKGNPKLYVSDNSIGDLITVK